MIKKYLASGRSSIQIVEYDRETESFLYLGDVKTAKKTKYSEHFDTYAEAYQWLMERVDCDIKIAQRDVEMLIRLRYLIADKHSDNVVEEFNKK
jgi:hypothetical protein